LQRVEQGGRRRKYCTHYCRQRAYRRGRLVARLLRWASLAETREHYENAVRLRARAAEIKESPFQSRRLISKKSNE